jgi:alpha-L-rhamnosidase
MTSFNHYALGSVGAWLHGTVGGISAAEPGWKKVLFKPVPGGTVKHNRAAKASYSSFLDGFLREENIWMLHIVSSRMKHCLNSKFLL